MEISWNIILMDQPDFRKVNQLSSQKHATSGRICQFWAIFELQSEAVAQRCSVEKVFLEISQNSQENTCARVSFLIKLQAQTCNFIKKETPAQVFSSKFCEISKNTSFTEHLWETASFITTPENRINEGDA